MSNLGTEFTEPSESSLVIQSLTQEATALMQEERGTPEYTAHALKLMGDLEGAKEKLGAFCVTVGEGDDRAIVLLGPLTAIKKTPLVLDIEPGRQQGTMTTTHQDRVLVNSAGVFRIINVVDQQLDDTGEGVNSEEWESRMRPLVRWNGEENERRLQQVLASGKYPESPQYPISGSGVQLSDDQYRALNEQRRQNSMGEYTLSPHWKSDVMVGSDTDYDTEPESGWSAGSGFRTVRITKPETVTNALKTSIPHPVKDSPTPG